MKGDSSNNNKSSGHFPGPSWPHMTKVLANSDFLCYPFPLTHPLQPHCFSSCSSNIFSPAFFRFGVQPIIPDPTSAQSASSTVLLHDPCGGVGAGGDEGRERLYFPRGELGSGSLSLSHTCKLIYIYTWPLLKKTDKKKSNTVSSMEALEPSTRSQDPISFSPITAPALLSPLSI